MSFRWQSGWHFERQDNGDVRVTLRRPVQEEAFVERVVVTRAHQRDPAKVESDRDFLSIGGPFVVLQDFTVPAAEWCSIVTSMCKGLETSERYDTICRLHGLPKT